ncbi:hypothetical protein MY4824_004809 [Beauveria thailandica]
MRLSFSALQVHASFLQCPHSWMLSGTTCLKDVLRTPPNVGVEANEAFGSQPAEPCPVTVTFEGTRLGPNDDGRGGVQGDVASSRRLNFCEAAAFYRHVFRARDCKSMLGLWLIVVVESRQSGSPFRGQYGGGQPSSYWAQGTVE